MGIVEARIKNFTYENDESPTLHAIDLNIEEGELVVLTGFSGCGKTTLTRILNGLIPYHYGGILDGEVRILGKNILDYKKGELAKYIGNVFQNPSDQFFATIAEEEVAFAGENLGMDFQTLCEKTDAAFQTMQIESLKGAINKISIRTIFPAGKNKRSPSLPHSSMTQSCCFSMSLLPISTMKVLCNFKR